MDLDQKIQWAIQMSVNRLDSLNDADWYKRGDAEYCIVENAMIFMDLQRECASEFYERERERAKKAHAQNESTPV